MKTKPTARLMMLILLILIAMGISGCASRLGLPMASPELDAKMKTFPPPEAGKSGLYIFRDSSVGFAIIDAISLDDVQIGKVPANSFIYRDIEPGAHTLSIPTEFSKYKIDLDIEPGKLCYVNYYIRMGVFRGNGALKVVEENNAKKRIKKLEMAQ